MYLSSLLINTGNDPDRPRPARVWLRNLYRVHQRLSMAFPSGDSKTADPFFLQPFDPASFTQALNNGEQRSPGRGLLFRVDHSSNGRSVILVQSAIIPDWAYAFQNTEFLAAPSQVRPFNPQFEPGAHLRFRLLANPTKKIGTVQKSARTNPNPAEPLTKKQLNGHRRFVPNDQLDAWLESRAETSGFRILHKEPVVPGYILALKNKDSEKGAGTRFRSALYSGVLSVEDPTAFRQTLIQGIGPAKAFGFGLLSVAPIS